ncbi:Putative membrane protein [Liberibacter crescens BT-1]|uniref:Putative membrane protein n=1 Tax=Liberibacter crescens (strain BT-1) TaxID=1215343 RepID=L0EUA0_LIBCB|nr:SLC13 family permease [Liberibacter crescens]AGA64243.1 Putative membrane protein [Liberibacter crescens BT-1]AMC12483.1 membrane protein [Liberibacter crescens]
MLIKKSIIFQLIQPFVKDWLLHFLLLTALILYSVHPQPFLTISGFIDNYTIVTITGLMMLTKGIEMSGFFNFIGHIVLRYLYNERWLALFLVIFSAFLSAFLTNDIALFIVIPLTISLRTTSALSINKLIVFQAMAVNAGSLLTPIGNPQNILLWHSSKLSFFAFIQQMFPLCIFIMFSLLALTWLCFQNRILVKEPHIQGYSYKRQLLWCCIGLYFLFMFSLKMSIPMYGLIIVFIGFLILERDVLLHIDWCLIIVFCIVFIDIGLLTRLPALGSFFQEIATLSRDNLYILGIGFSQVISNVPATILLLKYIPSNQFLAYVVNIGGFGFATSSFANLIALRMAGNQRIWFVFHFYSVLFLVWTSVIGAWFLKLDILQYNSILK